MQTTVSLDLPMFFPAHAFPLPGILPPSTCLMLDLRARTALLFHQEPGATVPLVGVCSLTPSAASVFLALLQAYPQHCSYQQLFMALSATFAKERRPAWDPVIGLRPIRRALLALSPALHAFGLEAVALRTRGYLLASAPPLAETAQGRMASHSRHRRSSLPGLE